MKSLRSLVRTPSLIAAAAFAVGGGGFVVATLIMARVLDTAEFSHAVLMIALCNVAVAVGPSAINGIALRHDRRTDRRLVMAGGICILVTALLIAIAARLLYALPLLSVAVLCFAIVTGGFTLLTRSAFQRQLAMQRIVLVHQGSNIALLLSAVLMLVHVGTVHWFPTLTVAVCYLGLGIYAWRWVMRNQRAGLSIERSLWRDGINFGGVALASEVMMQLERLLLPLAMSASDLAIFAVVAAVALTPYRMLEMGTMATLVARLRALDSRAERLRMLQKEGAMLLTLSVVGGVFIIVLAPRLGELVFEEAQITVQLTVATVISGVVRVLSALAHSTALAFGTGRELRLLNASNWLAVAVGALLGVRLSGFGLEGFIYGVALGWVCRAILAGVLAGKHLRA